MKYYEKILDGITEVLKWATAVLMFAMVAIVSIEVVRRYGIQKTWQWSDELVRYMIVWATFLGGPAAFRKGGLTCFDLVVLKMPENIQDILKYVVNTITLALCAFILKYSIVVIQSPAISLMKSASLKMSMSIPYLSIPIGMILMILFALDNYFVIHAQIKEKKQQGGQIA